MELTPHIEALRASLHSIAGDDEAAAAMAERLSSALDASLHLQLLDLLSQIALELNEQVQDLLRVEDGFGAISILAARVATASMSA